MKKHTPEKNVKKANPESDERQLELKKARQKNMSDQDITEEHTLYLCNGEKPDCEKTFCSFLDNGACRHTTEIKYAKNKGKRHYERIERPREIVFVETEDSSE